MKEQIGREELPKARCWRSRAPGDFWVLGPGAARSLSTKLSQAFFPALHTESFMGLPKGPGGGRQGCDGVTAEGTVKPLGTIQGRDVEQRCPGRALPGPCQAAQQPAPHLRLQSLHHHGADG